MLFDDTKLNFFDYDEMNMSTVVDWTKSYSWDLESTFHFFTHPGVLNRTFPCTTKLGGTTPGRPCVFPITYYDNKTYDSCFLMDTTKPACLTKLIIEDDGLPNYDIFGYCLNQCSGELPGPSSPYNLARHKHGDLWRSFFYDLSSYDNGHCHTYNPPVETPPVFTQRLYFMLANIGQYKDYDLFLHERDQFWPRSDMFSFGQSEPVVLPPGTELEVVFKVKEVTMINREEHRCVEDQSYSLTKCLQKYIEEKSNCHINFAKDKGQERTCSIENFKKYHVLLIRMRQNRISHVVQQSGCYPKCKVVRYSFDTTVRPIDWKPNWTSEVYIEPKSSFVKYSVEYLNFDSTDLISSIGGNLGLFLGWSFLTFTEAFCFMLCFCKRKRLFRDS